MQPPFRCIMEIITGKISKVERTMNIENLHDKFFKETFSDIDLAKDFLQHGLPACLVEKIDQLKRDLF